VVENGEQCRHEDDGGQNGECEDLQRATGIAEFAEDHGGAIDRMREQAGYRACALREDELSEAPLDDEEGEEDLQGEPPSDGAPADGAAIGGEGVGDAK